MKINVQVENDNKELVNSISSSIKERNSMLRDFLTEMRKMQSMSMDKLMSMMKKMHRPNDNASIMASAMRESSKANQSMMRTMKSLVDKKESNYEHSMKSMMDNSNSLIKSMKDMSSHKPESKTVVVKTVNNKSIEDLADAIRSGALNRNRWIPSAS